MNKKLEIRFCNFNLFAVILGVGLEAISHKKNEAKWASCFFLRVPLLLQYFVPKLINGFYSILIEFVNEKRVVLNQSEELNHFLESFVSILLESQLITLQEAENLTNFQRTECLKNKVALFKTMVLKLCVSKEFSSL